MGSCKKTVIMRGQAVYLVLFLAMSVSGQKVPHNLPVLFQYADKAHNVAVFRGAELRQAIAAGLVPGFGNLGREGKKMDTSADDMAAADAARAAADARLSQLDLAEKACVQACMNLAGHC